MRTIRALLPIALAAAVAAGSGIYAQSAPPAPAASGAGAFVPVTSQMLLNPRPDDWLMFSRTYDAQRHSPLRQITRQNVGQLREVFKKELGNGPHESIPLVYRGVMYLLLPGATLQAVNASTGALIWEHKRPIRPQRRQDDRHLRRHDLPDRARRLHRGARRADGRRALGDEDLRPSDVRRRRRRRQGDLRAAPAIRGTRTATSSRTTRGPGRNCGSSSPRPGRTSPAATPGAARPTRRARRPRGAWPAPTTRRRRRLIWGVANPTPNTRANRHGGNSDAIPTFVAGRSLQQLDDRARHRHRQARLVLPAPAGRRLGSRTTPTSARCSAPPSIRIRSSSSGSTPT